MTLTELRTKHPRLIYTSYQAHVTSDGLYLEFELVLEPDIVFRPNVTIAGVTKEQWETIPEPVRNQWVFHLGLAEIPSYWKAAAPAEILIKAGSLTSDQLSWWHELLIKGMGEYFFVNQIEFTAPDFVQFTQDPTVSPIPLEPWELAIHHQYLLPIGGGKESTLALTLFNESHQDYGVFLLNPTPAASDITGIAQPAQTIVANRTIDPKLLELNQQGYLNGHVPFSSYLAFLSRFVGHLFGYQQVAIANERSSNEGNVRFLGQEINHQYSKTFAFEDGFEQYLHRANLAPVNAAPSFFSLLRPWYEVQIGKALARRPAFPQYAHHFRSCNRGQKTNSWCGECPKCLFTFVSLYPFLPDGQVTGIFGKHLLDDPLLILAARALLGITDTKPFECVGTREENLAAFYLSYQKAHQQGRVPVLLQQVWDEFLSHQPDLEKRTLAILTSWNDEHHVPAVLIPVLRHALSTT